MRETHLRSILKAVSWRITATMLTIIIVYVFTGRMNIAISVGLLELLVKTAAYYGHERLWQAVKFGLK